LRCLVVQPSFGNAAHLQQPSLPYYFNLSPSGIDTRIHRHCQVWPYTPDTVVGFWRFPVKVVEGVIENCCRMCRTGTKDGQRCVYSISDRIPKFAAASHLELSAETRRL
jgi:hypothetical protein